MASLTLTGQNDSVEIIATQGGATLPNWARVSGSGAGAGVGGSGTVSPTDITITGASSVAIAPAADGTPMRRVTVTFTWPTPLGTTVGFWAWWDEPDSSGGLHVADGTIPSDGTQPANNTFNPKPVAYISYQDVTTRASFHFDIPAPKNDEYGRVYATVSSQNQQKTPIMHGVSGESPNWQVLISAGGSTSSTPSVGGAENCPNVDGVQLGSTPRLWTANPNTLNQNDGSQIWEIAVAWQWPDLSPDWSKVGGINFVVDDGATQRIIGHKDTPKIAAVNGRRPVGRTIDSWTSPAQPIRVPTQTYTLWFQAYDVDGNVNTIVPGVTPSLQFTIVRPKGGAGVEYAPLAKSDGVHAFVTAVTYTSTADGTATLRVTGYWDSSVGDPTSVNFDSRYGGMELVVLQDTTTDPAQIYRHVASGRISPITNDIALPASAVTWKFFLRSVSSNNGYNSIVPGTTPEVDISVGSGSNLLNLGKSAPSSFSSEFITSGGVFTQQTVNLFKAAGYNTSQFNVSGSLFNVLALSAAIINTGLLQVGGGGSKVSQMKIFDTLNSLIGWIGDDTGVSGFVGAWFKQCRIGGSSPSGAPFLADSSGNVSLNGATFTLTTTSGGATVSTKLTNQAGFGSSGTLVGGVQVTDGTNGIVLVPGGLQLQGTTSITPPAGIFQTGSGFTLTIDNVGCSALTASSVKIVQFLTGSASSGSATLPSNPVGFFLVTAANGTTYKVPAYA